MTTYACSLTGADRGERARSWSQLRTEALVCAESDGLAVTACWRPDPGVRERLDALIAAENECCPFLSFAYREHPSLLVTVLAVPAGGESFLGLLAD